MTTMSMRIASRFRAVSTNVSPLTTEDPLDEIFTVSSKKMELLKAIPIGKKTVSSRVGKALGMKMRRALFYLDQLEDDGYLESTWDVIQHKKSNARTRARVFTRIK